MSRAGKIFASTSLCRAVLVCMTASWVVSAEALEVTITGDLTEELVSAVEGGSLLVEFSNAEEAKDVREIVSSAQADYRRVLAILYDNGYFGPVISIKLDRVEAADIVAVTPPDAVSQAVIDVRKGSQFRFGNLSIEPIHPDTRLPKEFAPGETAQISVAQAATRNAISSWRDAGHAKAEMTDQEITARHAEALIDLDVDLDPGPKLRFGALAFEGTSAVRTERILEIAGLPEGEVFSPKELRDAADRLRRTGSFRSVAMVEGEVAPDGETLPVEVRIVDNDPRRIGFGGELSTSEGLTLTGFWMHRNLFGGAERLRFDAEISGIGADVGISEDSGGLNYLLRGRLDRPATFGADIGTFVLGEIERLDEPNYLSEQVTVVTGLEYFYSDNITYQLAGGFRRANTEDAFGDSDYTLFVLPSGGLFDYRDNEFDARRGFYVDADLTPFYAIEGTDSGLWTELDMRGYFSLGEESPTTLALRVQVGSVAGPSLQDAPTDFLFYSGGGGTVRGQEYESLGIQVGPDEDEDLVGGRSFLGISTEVRFRTEGALGFVGFFDAGYIGEEAFPDGSSGEWHSGAGVGVRYATPIGPIRFDLAVPTSGDTSDDDFQLYFGIGQAF